MFPMGLEVSCPVPDLQALHLSRLPWEAFWGNDFKTNSLLGPLHFFFQNIARLTQFTLSFMCLPCSDSHLLCHGITASSRQTLKRVPHYSMSGTKKMERDQLLRMVVQKEAPEATQPFLEGEGMLCMELGEIGRAMGSLWGRSNITANTWTCSSQLLHRQGLCTFLFTTTNLLKGPEQLRQPRP